MGIIPGGYPQTCFSCFLLVVLITFEAFYKINYKFLKARIASSIVFSGGLDRPGAKAVSRTRKWGSHQAP